MQKLYVYKCIKNYIGTTISQGGRCSLRVMTPGVPPRIAKPLRKFPGRNWTFFMTLKHGITTSFSHHTHTGKNCER